MQSKELAGNGDSDNDTNNLNIAGTLRSVISTIVTVDFFVVCALLVWFLTGIFASAVLDNDAIQIAFNGIFESVVQPALGILMIAALAGAVVGDEEGKEAL